MKTEVVLTMFGAVTRERRMGRKPFAGGGGEGGWVKPAELGVGGLVGWWPATAWFVHIESLG